MTPLKNENIYPFTEENIAAVLKFYFSGYSSEEIYSCAQIIYKKYNLEMNQIEFVAKHISKYIDFIKKEMSTVLKPDHLSNIMKYGKDAIFVRNENLHGSKNRNRITGELKRMIFND